MYFDKDLINFFIDLSANNNRDWFQDNKKRYEKSVKKPFQAFVTDVIAAIKKEYDPKLELETKNALFRINRDIRFSKDKTPYNTHVSAVVSRGGRKDMLYPGIFFRINPEGFHIGGGAFMPGKEDLYRIRETLISKGKKAQSALNDKNLKAHFPDGIIGEKNKVLPKEFKEAAESQPLIYNKQFYMASTYAPERILEDDILKFLTDHYGAMEPWNAFIREALGLK